MSNADKIELIQGRINQYYLENKRADSDTTKRYNQGCIQGLKQALEILKGGM